MSREKLRAANRAVLRAIETPPDTGIERRLDDIAAEVWFLAEVKDRRPDQGRLARVEHALTEVIRDAPEPRVRAPVDRSQPPRRVSSDSRRGLSDVRRPNVFARVLDLWEL